MKVRDVMTGNVKSCSPELNLAAAAKIMWDNDCGAVPVTDAAGRVTGMITDRDICMAVAGKNRLAAEITVGEVISHQAHVCQEDDDIQDALELMRREQVRRLPVVNSDGVLQGILSINDVVLRSKKGKSKDDSHIPHKDVMRTIKALSQHHHLPEAQ